MNYGKELIIDLKDCNITKFNRKNITEYFVELCTLIDMQREDLHFWDDEGISEEEKRTEPHVVGITAIQFIITSSITIHALTLLKEVYVNIFSCNEFGSHRAAKFTADWFGSNKYEYVDIERGGDFRTHGRGNEKGIK